MKNLGAEATNYATGIKAKAMILLADFVDAGQADGTIAKQGDAGRGRSIDLDDDQVYSLPKVLGTDNSNQAYDVVRQSRRVRDAVGDSDTIDRLIKEANESGQDFGIAGLVMEATAAREPEPVETPPLPPGKYRCIVADPPWPMDRLQRQLYPGTGKKLDYPTMTIEEIAALPVADHAADNAHLCS